MLNSAQRIGDQLARIDGIVAVALGGSWARGTAQPGSDVDIGIYYRATQPPSLAALQRLAQQLDDRHLLKHALIDLFLWQAEFALAVARKAVDRNDVFYVSGCLFQNVACLVQVLYALNERFFVKEKGTLAEAEAFPICASDFGAVARSV